MASSSRATCIDDLPSEIIAHAFTFLPVEAWFCTAPCVCRRWRLIIRATPLSPPLLSIRGFHATFSKTIWSCIRSNPGGLHGGKCKTEEQVEAVAAFIESNAEIEKWTGNIFLHKNYMGDANGMILAKSLKANKTMKKIHLDFNSFTDASGAAFADAIKLNVTLEYIGFNGNSFTDTSGVAIAEALNHNEALEEIGLHGIGFTDASAAVFAKVIKLNNTLKRIDLGKNSFTDTSADALIDALRHNSSLELLYLCGNNFGYDKKAAIRAAAGARGKIKIYI